jgi:methyl-accepting chemotaxis protein
LFSLAADGETVPIGLVLALAASRQKNVGADVVTAKGVDGLMASVGVDPSTLQKARALRQVAIDHVERAGAAYCDHLDENVPDMRDIVRAHRTTMIASERRHLEVLFSGQLGSDYLQALNDATSTDFAEALGARTRLGTIVRLVGPLFAEIRRSNRLSPGRALDQCEALMKLLLADALAATVTHQRAERRNLTARKQELEAAAATLQHQIQSLADGLRHAASVLRTAATASSAGSRLAGHQAAAAEDASRECARRIASAAAATQDFAQALRRVEEETQHSRDIAGIAVAHSEEVTMGIAKLAEATHRIGSIVTSIQEIATKTNLLALNATIEAARAGAAGRGFGVVAGEVKTLAQQTAKATDDIATQIAAVQSAAEDCASFVEAITQTIGRLDRSSATIAETVRTQSATTSAIVVSAHDVATQAQAGLTCTQESRTAILAVSERSADLDDAAQQVERAATQITDLVDRCVEDIRGV